MHTGTGTDIIWLQIGIALIIGAAVYFVPSITAYVRHHHNRLAILILNVFLGWTLLGWVAALVWASTRVEREPPGPHSNVERKEPTFMDKA